MITLRPDTVPHTVLVLSCNLSGTSPPMREDRLWPTSLDQWPCSTTRWVKHKAASLGTFHVSGCIQQALIYGFNRANTKVCIANNTRVFPPSSSSSSSSPRQLSLRLSCTFSPPSFSIIKQPINTYKQPINTSPPSSSISTT